MIFTTFPLPKKRFPDGGQYRFEVPGIQGPGPMKALLEALDEFGVKIHRVTQTKGIMFLTDDEIRQMVEYAKKWDVQLILACGPRATTDTSASVKTEEGLRMGYRLRGEEQIARGIEEIKRGARLRSGMIRQRLTGNLLMCQRKRNNGGRHGLNSMMLIWY